MASLLIVSLILLNVYLGLIWWLHRRGQLGDRVQLAGPLLLLKTQVGKKTIDRIAKWRRAWLIFADAGIVATWLAGILMFALLILMLSSFLDDPATTAANAPAPQYLIGLPGVNPLIPLWYGLFGLIVALVVHEGCHGILARAQDLKVKSLGLLLFVIPIGAFVEPDEKDLEHATTRQKNRVFAAGPMSNIVLAIVTASLFAGLVSSSVVGANGGHGVGITTVVADFGTPGVGAHEAGIAPGDIVVGVNGIKIDDLEDFNRVMAGTRAGERVTVDHLREGTLRTSQATLADKYAYIARIDPSQNEESFRGKGFLGVTTTPLPGGLVDSLAHPLASLSHFQIFISYPFFMLGGVNAFEGPYANFVELEGGLASVSPAAFVVSANALYWLFWLNLMLGTFNALPAGPLDGGQMFRATFREWLLKWYRVDRQRLVVEANDPLPGYTTKGSDPETQAKLDRVQSVLKRTTRSLGFFILGLLLIPVFAKVLAPLFG